MKTKFGRIVLIAYLTSILFASLICALALTIKGNLVFEVVASFMPYLVPIILVNLIILIIIFRKSIRKLNPSNRITKIVKRLFNIGTVGLSLLLLMVVVFIWNYSFSPAIIGSSQITAATKALDNEKFSYKLRVVFFNKHYLNRDYSEINQAVQDLNPEVISFAEFSQKDADSILVLKNYPYQFSTKSSEFFLNTYQALYSKYPLKDISTELAETLPFISARLELPTDPQVNIRIVSIHTAAPVTQKYYELRSRQLAALSSYLRRPEVGDFLLMGDFNLTPWSPTFQEFQSQLPEKTRNLGQGRGFQFTWRFDTSNLLRMQLDQLYLRTTNNPSLLPSATSLSWRSSGLQVTNTFGSDHCLIYTDLEYK